MGDAPFIPKVPDGSRDPKITFSDIEITTAVGPWDAPLEKMMTCTRYRMIGTCKLTMSLEGYKTRHTNYSIIQREKINSFYCSASSYDSAILVGGLVDVNHEMELLRNGRSSGESLWCTNCWAQDMYVEASERDCPGGVKIPLYMMGDRYFSTLDRLHCEHCGYKYRVFSLAHYRRKDVEAYLFSGFKHRQLMDAIEAHFAPLGIFRTSRLRPEEGMSEELREELIAVAMAPERVEEKLRMVGGDLEKLELIF